MKACGLVMICKLGGEPTHRKRRGCRARRRGQLAGSVVDVGLGGGGTLAGSVVDVGLGGGGQLAGSVVDVGLGGGGQLARSVVDVVLGGGGQLAGSVVDVGLCSGDQLAGGGDGGDYFQYLQNQFQFGIYRTSTHTGI